MEGLGHYSELAAWERLFGAVLLVGVLALTVVLERLQLQLRARETSAWWASNGRDVLNALAFALTSLGLVRSGFSVPLALAAASTPVIAINVVQATLEGRPRLALGLSLGVVAVFATPVLFFPEALHRALRWGLEQLFE